MGQPHFGWTIDMTPGTTEPSAAPLEGARRGPLASGSLPLCVDMDGTLLRIDTLHEAALAAFAGDPRTLLQAPGWLAAGKQRLKAELGRRWSFDPALLPYHPEFLAWLREQHAAGRHIVLCTAANHAVAEQVAGHLGLFDEVIASDETRNLRGPAKAEALVARFGERGFAYAGNDRTDLAVWRHAGEAILVGAPAALAREAEAEVRIAGSFDAPQLPLAAFVKAIRPYQWVKNALCFVPLLVSGDWLSTAGWLGAGLAAIAFCLAASSIYLLNDMTDIAADREHARKRKRPFAAGTLPILWGLAAAPVMMLAALALAGASGMLTVLLGYIACSLLYTFGLKEKPLVDVFLLTALYCARILGGGEASGHPVSLWLLAFASFLFLSLALIKRVSEMLRVVERGGKSAPRRGYRVEDIPTLQMFGTAAVFASAIVLSLYLQSSAALKIFANPGLLWVAVPLLLFWQCRLWLATNRGWMHDDPILYTARDWVSWITFGLLAVATVAARALG